MSEVRPWEDEDGRREVAVEMMKRHVRAQRPDSDYDADIEYLERALVAFADEWAQRDLARPAELQARVERVEWFLGQHSFERQGLVRMDVTPGLAEALVGAAAGDPRYVPEDR